MEDFGNDLVEVFEVDHYTRLKENTFDMFFKSSEKKYNLHNIGLRCECAECEEYRERIR